MNLLSLFRKPAHTEVRFVVASKRESEQQRIRALTRKLELTQFVSRLTPEQAQAARMRGMGGGR